MPSSLRKSPRNTVPKPPVASLRPRMMSSCVLQSTSQAPSCTWAEACCMQRGRLHARPMLPCTDCMALPCARSAHTVHLPSGDSGTACWASAWMQDQCLSAPTVRTFFPQMMATHAVCNKLSSLSFAKRTCACPFISSGEVRPATSGHTLQTKAHWRAHSGPYLHDLIPQMLVP